MSQIMISSTGHNKNVHDFFIKRLVILQFFLKCVPHFWHCNALNVFFTWINTRIWWEMSYLRKKFQDEMVHEKTSTNKAQYFFGVSSRRYQDFRHILQNPKIPTILYTILYYTISTV